MDVIRIADDKGDRHRLAQRPAEPQEDAADDADARIGEDDLPGDLRRRRAQRIGALLQHRRHGQEHVAHDRGNQRQHHDREDEPRGQDADAERRPGEQQAQPGNFPERADQRRLDIILDKRRQHKKPPDPVDDAGDRGQKLDHRRQRALQPDRAQFGDEEGDPERHRDRDQHRDRRGDEGAVDRRQRTEFLGDRVPHIGDEETRTEGRQRRQRARDQRCEDAAEQQQHDQRENDGKRAEGDVGNGAAPRSRRTARLDCLSRHPPLRSTPWLSSRRRPGSTFPPAWTFGGRIVSKTPMILRRVRHHGSRLSPG